MEKDEIYSQNCVILPREDAKLYDDKDISGENISRIIYTEEKDTPIGAINSVIEPLKTIPRQTRRISQEDDSYRKSNKRIFRKGNTFTIRDNLPNAEEDDISTIINDLYEQAVSLSASSNYRAGIFNTLNILSKIFITLAGTVIGVLSLQGFETDITKYIGTVLGFSITTIQTLLSTFSIEKRSVLLKDTSNKLRKTSREVRALQYSRLTMDEKIKKLELLYAEVDELDLNIFDNNITTSNRKGFKQDFYEDISTSKSSPTSRIPLSANTRVKLPDD